MLSGLHVKGYKSLYDISLSLSALNVFVGANASGKSSVIQTLLLLRQSSNEDGSVSGLRLSGPLYEAGVAQDIFHPESEYKLQFRLQYENQIYDFRCLYDRDEEAGSVKSRFLEAENALSSLPLITERSEKFAYLSAERLGPRVRYELPQGEDSLGGVVGVHGEYTTAALARSVNSDGIDGWDSSVADYFISAIQLLDNVDFGDLTMFRTGRLDEVSNQILSWIIPGSYFHVDENTNIDAASLRFVRDPQVTNSTVRATHIGFGLSYTLPIIVAALSLKKNGVLIVENPEAHLHPFSQSRIGAFLAIVAGSGRQVILETHSDHVLNGVRLSVAKEIIRPELAQVHFFKGDRKTSKTKVQEIKLSAGGYVDSWPPGFFDQVEKDLSRL